MFFAVPLLILGWLCTAVPVDSSHRSTSTVSWTSAASFISENDEFHDVPPNVDDISSSVRNSEQSESSPVKETSPPSRLQRMYSGLKDKCIKLARMWSLERPANEEPSCSGTLPAPVNNEYADLYFEIPEKYKYLEMFRVNHMRLQAEDVVRLVWLPDPSNRPFYLQNLFDRNGTKLSDEEIARRTMFLGKLPLKPSQEKFVDQLRKTWLEKQEKSVQ